MNRNMEDWEPDETSEHDGRRAYFWLIPANVGGTWNIDARGERMDVTLEQKFQKVDGTIALGQIKAGLRDLRLRGASISFAFVDNTGVRRDFSGRVTANRMEGTFRTESGTDGRWTAAKR